MTETEKAYIAGIIDGEGSIMLIRFHSNQLPSPCISISSATIELLEWIKTKVNAGSIKNKKNYKPNKHKDSFTYELKYNKAFDLLNDIYPYLIIKAKKKKAELILNTYKIITSRNGRYSPEQIEAKENFYKEFMSIK